MLVRLGILVLLYSAARVLFLIYNHEILESAPPNAVPAAFLTGFRSDLLAILLTNSLLIALAALGRMTRRPWDEKFLNVIFLVCNLPFLVINIVDLEYVKFTGERSSLALWDVKSDIPFQLGNFIFYYWRLALIAGVFIFLACFFLPNGSSARRPARNPGRKRTVAAFGVAGLLLLGSGFAEHPSNDPDAGVDRPLLEQLAQNSTLTLLGGRVDCAARPVGPPTATLARDSNERLRASTETAASRAAKDNVVIIIVESLSSEYTGAGGYAPFLEELADKGRAFPHHFANGRRSIDSLPSILLGVPRLTPATFGCVASRRFESFASILREHGYRTLFFHGGRNGTGDFESFTRQIGFARYFGEDEYGDSSDSDGIWGIYDGPFLRFMARELASEREPFVAVVFTLSTHQPYKIPAEYADRFAKGTLPIHQSLGYTDHALREFFSVAEKMPWSERTLFVITGDHTGPPAAPRRRLIDAYRVPLILYHPGAVLPSTDPNRVAQHFDIPASIFDHLGMNPARLLPFGRSVFERDYDGTAYGKVDDRYWIVSGKHYLEESARGKADVGHVSGKPLTDGDEAKLRKRLLAELQSSIDLFNEVFAE